AMAGGHSPSRPATSTRVDRALVDEAERIAPRVVAIEAALAPGADDGLAGGRAVDVAGGEAAEALGAGVDGVEIGDGEIERLGRRVRVRDRDDLKGHGTSRHIDPTTRLRAWDTAEQGRGQSNGWL